MKIEGFQKLTLQDFPNNMACIIFTKGCNFECPFCHNSSLVINKNEDNLIDESKIFEYLEKRRGILDGVVISGGEPLVQKDIKEFIKKVRWLKYKIKLDTNGFNYELLKELIDEKLVDYVAMDIKNSFDKYNLTIGKNLKIDNVIKSIELLKHSNIDFEFRTTIVKEFHDIDDIRSILKVVDGNKYFVQNFEDSGSVIKDGLHSFTIEELKSMNDILSKEFTNFKFRNL